jgi:hypothetical protein
MLNRRAFNAALIAAAAMPLTASTQPSFADVHTPRVSIHQYRPIPRDALPDPSTWQLKCHNGRMIAQLTYKVFYWGDVFATSDAQLGWRGKVDAAINTAMSDSTLNAVFTQYIKVSQPASNSVSSTPRISQILGTSLGAMFAWSPRVTQADAAAAIRLLLGQSVEPRIDPTAEDFSNFAAVFVLPPGTVMEGPPNNPKEQPLDSLDGLGAYHTSLSTGASQLYYSVVAWSDGQNGTANPGWDGWENVAANMYHELAEIRTNPDVGSGWYMDFDVDPPGKGQEIADLADLYYQPFPQDAMYRYKPLVPVSKLWANSIPGPYDPSTSVSQNAAQCP